MEKRLRSSLKSSAEEFISTSTELKLKSSKSTLKTLIHNISTSSPLTASLPSSLHNSISNSILSFQNLLQNPPLSSPLDPAKSPPLKRPRRSSSRRTEPKHDSNLTREKHETVDKLQILTHITFLCVSHPKKMFSPSDLLPAVQLLHDNLVLFESDLNLSLEVASLCEFYWKENLPGREMLISQFIPFLVSRSLTSKRKIDVHKVCALREAFNLFDFEDESIEDLKLLLIRCIIAPLYLKTEDGKRFLAFMLGLSMQLLKDALAMIKSQIPFGRKSILEGYGEILFRAWKGVNVSDFKDEIENRFLQGLVENAIYARSDVLAASIRRVLGGFVCQRITAGVEKLLFRLAEPVIFRSLQVASPNVRLNALHLLLDLFPLEDPDVTKEVKDTLLEKQFFLLERLLMDDCPDIRVVAVEGCCRVLHLFWEIIPSPTITKILTKIFDDMSLDICNEVRLSTLNGIVYLLGNPQSHEILKVLLQRLGHLIMDKVLSIRSAAMDLLLLIRDIPSFQFNKVVGLDVLLSILANDQPQVAQKITRLLIPSYFPSKVSTKEACNRCVTLIKRSPMAGARFCEFAVSEGASLKSLMELVRALISFVLTHDKLDAVQKEGVLAAASYLCNGLVGDTCYKNALKELFSGGKAKSLYAVASTRCAQSSVLKIFSAICSEDVDVLLEECIHLITKCNGISENVELQDEVRSAHKLMLSCDSFDDMFEALTKLLQKTAYRCHIKFGVEMPKQRTSPGKRKKCKSAVKVSAKWKHRSGKTATNFEDDYSIALGIAWQIKDLLAHKDSRKAMLGSQALEVSFLALKVISEVCIIRCVSCEYVDSSPVLAYTALALHMTLQNENIKTPESGQKKKDRTDSSSILEPTLLDETTDHLLNCTEKLLAGDDSGVSSNSSADPTQEIKKALRNREKQKDSQKDASTANNDGSLLNKEKIMSNKVKMLTTILKFIVDSTAMGFFSNNHRRCLSFTSSYLKHVICILGKQFSEGVQFKEDTLKESILCLKISFSYAAKLLNLILKGTNKASQPSPETFYLANDLLDLITSIELYLGSSFAARLAAAAKPWLPDLIIALGFGCLLEQNPAESTYMTALSHVKLQFPSWPLILSKTVLCEMSKDSPEEEGDRDSEPDEFPLFKKFIELILPILKRNPKVLDAVGVIFLTFSVIGLEKKDFGLVLGLLHFVCVKLVGQEDREWTELDMMLSALPDIYPQIERESEEQTNDEDAMQKLESARVLLEPVWLYHVYETGRFTVMEE